MVKQSEYWHYEEKGEREREEDNYIFQIYHHLGFSSSSHTRVQMRSKMRDPNGTNVMIGVGVAALSTLAFLAV